MQDVDFSRFYRREQQNNRSGGSHSRARAKGQERSSFFSSRMLLWISFFILFSAGVFTGIRVQSWIYQKQIDSNIEPSEISLANIPRTSNEDAEENSISDSLHIDAHAGNSSAPAEQPATQNGVATTHSEENFAENLRQAQDAYIILARIYDDEREAHRQGLVLKKEGLDVFLARSGDRMKVYVGPVEGKQEAYGVLMKVKKHSEFKSAIMYKK